MVRLVSKWHSDCKHTLFRFCDLNLLSRFSYHKKAKEKKIQFVPRVPTFLFLFFVLSNKLFTFFSFCGIFDKKNSHLS